MFFYEIYKYVCEIPQGEAKVFCLHITTAYHHTLSISCSVHASQPFNYSMGGVMWLTILSIQVHPTDRTSIYIVQLLLNKFFMEKLCINLRLSLSHWVAKMCMNKINVKCINIVICILAIQYIISVCVCVCVGGCVRIKYTASYKKLKHPCNGVICDRLCENRPCLHLVVIRETLV